MSEKFTRREFLQSASVTLGALATPAVKAFAAEAPKGNEKGLPSCDVLIVGSGGSGLRAAIAVRQNHPNLSVVVVNKGMPSRNATCMAEGGINGVIVRAIVMSYTLLIRLKAVTILVIKTR